MNTIWKTPKTHWQLRIIINDTLGNNDTEVTNCYFYQFSFLEKFFKVIYSLILFSRPPLQPQRIICNKATPYKVTKNIMPINIFSCFKSNEATCAEKATEMKKCLRLKDMLNFDVLWIFWSIKTFLGVLFQKQGTNFPCL